IDHFSKWTITEAMQNQESETVARILIDKVILQHGIPEEIISDRGSNFASQMLKDIENLLGIKPKMSTSYHHQTAGIVERFNRTLTKMLGKTAPSDVWDEYLQSLTFAYNITPHETTAYTPYLLIHGHEARWPPANINVPEANL